MSNFAVLHVEKCSAGKGGTFHLGRHISRDHTPPNADPSRTELNQVFIDHGPNLDKAIDKRLQEGYQGKAKIRSNAVRSLNIVMSGSHERMKKIESIDQIDYWVEENRRFLEEEYGKENIVSLALHMDERTPHLHAVVVPLTDDGRLSAREKVGNRKKMQEAQDKYAKRMEKFGLKRGVKGSKATHEGIADYHKRLNSPSEILEVDFKKVKTKNGEMYVAMKESVLKQLIWLHPDHNKKRSDPKKQAPRQSGPTM